VDDTQDDKPATIAVASKTDLNEDMPRDVLIIMTLMIKQVP
jgi:hypothetical protein